MTYLILPVYHLTGRQNIKEMISKALWCIKYALHNLSHEYYTLLIVLKSLQTEENKTRI